MNHPVAQIFRFPVNKLSVPGRDNGLPRGEAKQARIALEHMDCTLYFIGEACPVELSSCCSG